MPLEPVQRSSVADAVFGQLLDGVLSGELNAGAELPAERALTEALGVNRQAVREALQRLAAAGLIDIRHGGRTRVTDYRRTAGLDLLPRLLLAADGTVDRAVATSIMELRACLGPEIAQRAAERADDLLRRHIVALAEEMAAAGDDLDLLAELDLALWDALVEGSDNIAYRLSFNGLRRTYEPLAELLRETLAEELTDHANRGALAAAVAHGDGPGAAAAARLVLAKGESAVVRLLETLTTDPTIGQRA